MNCGTANAEIDRPAVERAHSIYTSVRFLNAWKRGVLLSQTQLFGNGVEPDLKAAARFEELRPNYELIERSFICLGQPDKLFLALLVSIDNPQYGYRLLESVGFRGLADLGSLDAERRSVIASLIAFYTDASHI